MSHYRNYSALLLFTLNLMAPIIFYSKILCSMFAIWPIFTTLHGNTATTNAILGWTKELACTQYVGAVSQLTQVLSGCHFSMAQVSPTQVEDFQIDNMADHIKRTNPTLWGTHSQHRVAFRIFGMKNCKDYVKIISIPLRDLTASTVKVIEQILC